MILQAKNISKIIGSRKILDDITLSFSGGLTCVVGDSGAGKSTLLNILGGLDFPTSGDVCLDDPAGKKVSISDIPDYRKSCLGFVFQESNLINGLTTGENIELSTQISSSPFKSDDTKAVLEQFGLSLVTDTKVENISGGEKLRTAIARAVIRNAPIILADEPTGSLDHENSVLVFELLKKVSQNRIVIAVTHNLEMAKQYADRIVTISDGKIVRDDILSAGNAAAGNMKIPAEKASSEGSLSREMVRCLTLNNMKRYRAKFLLSLITTGIALAALAIVFLMQNSVRDTREELNTVYYDADLIKFYPYDLGEKNITSIVMPGIRSGVISEQMLLDLRNSNLFSAVIPVSDNYYLMPGAEKTIDCKIINLDDFFRKRLMTENVSGSFPQTDKQVIIARDISDRYFEGDAIGKTLTLTTESGGSCSYEIVGINSEKNVDGICYSYIPLGSLKEMAYEQLSAPIWLVSTVEDETRSYYTPDASGIVSECSGEEIVYGDSLTGTHQLLISAEMAVDIYHSMTGVSLSLVPGRLAEADAGLKECLDLVLAQEYYLGANNAYKCKVVGIHNGLSHKLIVSDEWKEEITRLLPNYVECYGRDMETVKNFEKEEIAGKYSYVSNYAERFEKAVSATGTWNLMFVIILVIVGMLCIVMVHAYGKTAIHGRMYEVGILGSLGLEKNKIRRLLNAEIYALGGGAWCCGSIFLFMYVVLYQAFTEYHFNFTEIICIMAFELIGVAVIIFLTGNHETKKAVKRTIIEAIRMRE